MSIVPLKDTLLEWALLDDDIVLAFEPEPQRWQRDIDLPDGLGEEVDNGQDGEPREEDDPRQVCVPWRRPPEKPAWLVQQCGRAHPKATPVSTTALPANGLAQVEAVFRGIGRLLKP